MAPKAVPSKIVIAGNSKMSLNDRFSSIPKARPNVAKKPKVVSQPRRVYEEVEVEEYEYVPRPVIRRPQQHHTQKVYQQRAVPIQNRVTFVKTLPVHRPFVPRKPFVHRNNVGTPINAFKKTFVRPNFNQQGGFHANNRFQSQQNGHNNQNNNKTFGKQFATMPKKKTLAELDRELEDYMRKPKHPPITI